MVRGRLVDAAFKKIGHKRPSDKISEVAKAMLTVLVPKKGAAPGDRGTASADLLIFGGAQSPPGRREMLAGRVRD
jgi:hypothetical protein